MALSLAHALEVPGKLRLNKEQYLAVQTIYYPGFTLGGIAEFASSRRRPHSVNPAAKEFTTILADLGRPRGAGRGAGHLLDHDPTREQVLASEHGALACGYALLPDQQRSAGR
jgi:hypothetical protein